MSTETEAIEQYLKDPLSMPEGAELTNMLYGGDEAITQPPKGSEQDDGENAAGATPGTTDTPTDGAGGQVTDEDPTKSVVKSRDGKHEIPYTVLQSERERAIRAERAAQDLTEKLALLEHAQATGKPIKTESLDDIVDEDMLSDLREESPGVADVLDRLIGKITSLESEQAKAAPFFESNAREADIQRQLSVEESISAVPKLAHIRTQDPDAYNEIAELDASLRVMPKWHDKPMAERFDTAVRMYEAANGPIELPGAKPETKPDERSQAQKVAAALAKANAVPGGPSTLSDIPGGHPAASNDHDALGELSSTALTERFMTMSPEQIEAELARLM